MGTPCNATAHMRDVAAIARIDRTNGRSLFTCDPCLRYEMTYGWAWYTVYPLIEKKHDVAKLLTEVASNVRTDVDKFNIGKPILVKGSTMATKTASKPAFKVEVADIDEASLGKVAFPNPRAAKATFHKVVISDPEAVKRGFPAKERLVVARVGSKTLIDRGADGYDEARSHATVNDDVSCWSAPGRCSRNDGNEWVSKERPEEKAPVAAKKQPTPAQVAKRTASTQAASPRKPAPKTPVKEAREAKAAKTAVKPVAKKPITKKTAVAKDAGAEKPVVPQPPKPFDVTEDDEA